MALGLGSAFCLKGAGSHLRIIITDPQLNGGHAVVVPVITFRKEWPNPDDACLLKPGEHSFLRVLSAIDYSLARVRDVSKLDAAFARGEIELFPSVSTAILQRILEGAKKSFRLKDEASVAILEKLFNSKGP